MSKPSYNLPEVVEMDESEIKHIIALVRSTTWDDKIKNKIIKTIELSLWLPLFLKNKAITLHKLRTMIFGKGYNNKEPASTTGPVIPSEPDEAPQEPIIQEETEQALVNHSPERQDIINVSLVEQSPNSNSTQTGTELTDVVAPKKPGHGRMSHHVYNNATDIDLLLSLTVGDECPTLCGGTLGPYQPGILIKVLGQNFADVYRYHVEKLRCNLCGIIISADIPPEAQGNKYDETFIAMLAVMKYYLAVPFYRQENFQRMLGFPLPDSTQWDLIERLAGYCYSIFNTLKRLSGNARLLHNDDTYIKILEVVKQIKDGTAGDRTGMYTTGILADYEGHKIALFLNGRKHSGENVADILKNRSSDKEPIIQMSDALSANIPKGLKSILCNCLAHGFRKFEEIKDYFGEKCSKIIEMLSDVFENDSKTKAMNHEERLSYHQEYSKPIMDKLKSYMVTLLEKKEIEPNDYLGKAIKYMLRHWDKLTRFLSVAGAPIDNNVVERMLKIAIRNRKSAMFYKTLYSAGIGGMITSIIYTCHLANENPVDYLVALQRYEPDIRANTEAWLPWCYRETMAKCEVVDANPQGQRPQAENLAAA